MVGRWLAGDDVVVRARALLLVFCVFLLQCPRPTATAERYDPQPASARPARRGAALISCFLAILRFSPNLPAFLGEVALLHDHRARMITGKILQNYQVNHLPTYCSSNKFDSE